MSIFNTHKCHWPGCAKQVPPVMWGCKPHWYKLPKRFRDEIWRHYRPGQEIDKTPSQEYWDVIVKVNQYCELINEGFSSEEAMSQLNHANMKGEIPT